MRVTGTINVGAGEHDLDIGGVVTRAQFNGSTGSLRVIGSWFPAGHQIALQSTRPLSSKGHDRDQIDVIALGEREAVAFDPRLSTTYSGGAPIETGIELWIGADEDADQYPRRVSGVATGAGVSSAAEDITVTAYALECLSRGELGAGVYLLVRPRLRLEGAGHARPATSDCGQSLNSTSTKIAGAPLLLVTLCSVPAAPVYATAACCCIWRVLPSGSVTVKVPPVTGTTR